MTDSINGLGQTGHAPYELDDGIGWSEPYGPDQAQELYLVLHGVDSSPETLADIRDLILDERADAQVLMPRLPFTWRSPGDLMELCHRLLDRLDPYLRSSTYERIRIVGHSAGGVVAQALYLLARTSRPDHPLARAKPKSLRLILIAPINRGWEITHHLPLTHKIAWAGGVFFAPLIELWNWITACFVGRPYRPLWLFQLRRGAPFLAWLRLTWVELKQRPNWKSLHMEVVQLLGTKDEIVSWHDMVDTATGDDFVYLEVPESDHMHIVDIGRTPSPDHDQPEGDARRRRERRRVLAAALAPDIAALRESLYAIKPWDTEPAKPDEKVQRVVFVIHGIRDEGHWTQKIASRARRAHATAGLERDQIAVVTSSYGFFSLIQFLLALARRRKVQWLLDLYVEARRRYPNARDHFSFIGHSNGTFLLAHGLRVYPQMRFQRIAFAGSVVSSRFDWADCIRRGQVGQVVNFVASADWVVGFLPRISDILPGKMPFGADIGGAGVQPFSADEGVINPKYRKGGHGAAIEENNWDTLARFAVCADTAPSRIPEPPDDYAPVAAWWLRPCIGPLVTVLVWLGLLALVPLLGWLAWRHPWYFLGSALAPLAIGVPAATWVFSQAGGQAFEKRRQRQERAGRIVRWMLAFIGVAWLGGALAGPFLPAAELWEGARTAGLFAYLLVLWLVLTNF